MFRLELSTCAACKHTKWGRGVLLEVTIQEGLAKILK